MIILLEPWISSYTADRVCKRLGRTRWIQSEVAGFSYGVWISWDEEEVSLRLEVANKLFLHLGVKLVGRVEWEITAVYASPNLATRRHLWAKLDGIFVKRLWVLLGVFNCVLHDEERSSNSGVSSSFQSWWKIGA